MRQALAILVVASGLLVSGCGGSTNDSADAPPAAAPSDATDAAGCSDVSVPEALGDGDAKASGKTLDAKKTYALVFATNCGSFTVTLDQASAPATAASLVSLASSGFYDGTIFHRIVPGFVIQGGDPTQTGSGGPGYKTVDPPAADATYTRGVVAMAKTGAEPSGTAGSQFFVVTGADVGLPPLYAVVGTITAGDDVIDRIGELGDPATEQPTRPIVISSVEVVEQ